MWFLYNGDIQTQTDTALSSWPCFEGWNWPRFGLDDPRCAFQHQLLSNSLALQNKRTKNWDTYWKFITFSQLISNFLTLTRVKPSDPCSQTYTFSLHIHKDFLHHQGNNVWYNWKLAPEYFQTKCTLVDLWLHICTLRIKFTDYASFKAFLSFLSIKIISCLNIMNNK